MHKFIYENSFWLFTSLQKLSVSKWTQNYAGKSAEYEETSGKENTATSFHD